MAIEFSALERAIETSWCKETSSEKDWTPENPAWGQCAVTAAVIDDYFPGVILNASAQVPGETKGRSHYWNRTALGDIDLTRKQFTAGTIIPEGIEKRTAGEGKPVFESGRAYVLAYPITVQRYELLKQRVEAALADHK